MRPHRLILRIGLSCAALGYLGAYIYVFLSRASYPFDLEWMEGGTLQTVLRIVHGQPIYVEPSLDYVPFLYTPFYYYAGALFVQLLGTGLFPLRLLSFLASLGTFGLVYAIVFRETRGYFVALLGVGLYAATFRIAGAWFDLARVDSLFLFLFLLGVYVLRYSSGALRAPLAALFLAFAIFTKQSALVMVLPLLLHEALFEGRRSVRVIVLFILFFAAGTLGLHLASGGWSTFYAYEMMGGHDWVPDRIRLFWTIDMRPVAALFLLAAAYGAASRWSASFRFFAFLGFGMIAHSYLSRLHGGGWHNVLMPCFLWLSLIAPLALDCFDRHRPRWQPLLLLLMLFQFGVLLYRPDRQIPSREDLLAGRKVAAALSGIHGEVFVPGNTTVVLHAGKRTYAHEMAIYDVLRSSRIEAGRKLRQDLRDAGASGKFEVLLLGTRNDNDTSAPILGDLDLSQNYLRTGPVLANSDSFVPVVHDYGRLTTVFLKKSAVEPERVFPVE